MTLWHTVMYILRYCTGILFYFFVADSKTLRVDNIMYFPTGKGNYCSAGKKETDGDIWRKKEEEGQRGNDG